MINIKNFFPVDRSQKHREEWHGLFDLIEEGHYDQAVEILDKDREINWQCGNSNLSALLGAVRQICAACNQFHAEANQHKQAGEEASKKENDLKQQLYALLNLASANEVAATAPKNAFPENRSLSSDHISEERPQSSWLWERIQAILKLNTENKLAKVPEPGEPMLDHPVDFEPYEEASAADLAIYCFGSFRVFRNEHLITPWNSYKGLAILKYLTMHHPTPILKEILMDVFWPDADIESARRNLHQAIYSLRQTLKRGERNFQPIQFENERYQFNPEINLYCDFEEFALKAKMGRQLESSGRLDEAAAINKSAEELYLGDFLEEDLYEDWIRPTRERYRGLYLDLADRLSEYHRQQRNFSIAIDICQKILARDSCNEKAHRRLMQCFQNQGQRDLAVRQYRKCVEMLKNELDISPAAETQRLYEKITAAPRA